jgi:hypothetical protein
VPVLAHVVLSFTLCAGPPAPPAPVNEVRVLLEDRGKRAIVDRTLAVRPAQRNYTMQFDSPPGVYRLIVSAAPQCNDTSFMYFLSGDERHVSVALHAGPPATSPPTYLFAGTVPYSERSPVRPAPALFDQSTKCDEPVGTQLPLRSSIEYDRGSYYFTLFSEPDVADGSQVLTFDLKPPSGTDHYVYIPMPFPIPLTRGGWPLAVRYDVSLELMVTIATTDRETASWMICPHVGISSAK